MHPRPCDGRAACGAKRLRTGLKRQSVDAPEAQAGRLAPACRRGQPQQGGVQTGVGLIRPLLEAQVRREVAAAAAEDKHDLVVRG